MGKTLRRDSLFGRGTLQKAKRLLEMWYMPSEICDEISVGTEVVNEWLRAGAPHCIDEGGCVWINGRQLRFWILTENNCRRYGARPKPGKAFCTNCRSYRTIAAPTIGFRVTKTHYLIKGRCDSCDTVTFKGFGSVKQTPPEFSGCDEIRDVRTGCAQTLICRSNWIDVMKFLDYIREVQQRATSTINSKRGSLQHLLRWAYDKPFAQCENMLPTFPNYLETVPVVYNYRPSGTFLLYKTREKACTNARQFLRWAMAGLPDRYGAMDRFWIDSLTPGPRREYSNDRRPFTIEEVRKIVMLPADSLRMRRDIAAVACIFLTGLRVGAFTTLPVTAFDFDAPVPTISQFPELGVETKNRRSAKTYALTIPDILQVVIHWHTFISDELGPNALWYARLTPRGESLDCDNTTSSGAGNRGGTVSRGLKMLCERAEVEYRSAHNLRHGHATYALSLAKGESERKHISQNLMHASLEVTERTYNNPSPAQVQRTIAAISRRTQGDQIETVTVEKIEGMIDTAVRNAMPMALFKTVLIACWYLLQMVRNVFNVLVRSGHDGDG